MAKEFFKKWLKEHEYCVLCTCFLNRPWAATVNYTADNNLKIYISCRTDSLKFQNLLKNPVVCLVIDSQTRKGTVQIQGIAESLNPKAKDEPNLLVKPNFLIFRKKHKSGEMQVLKLNLDWKK